MNLGLQSYTPTVHPLNYDSLAGRQGCDVESGLDIHGALAFIQLCSFEHDPNNPNFASLDRSVSYQVGPEVAGTSTLQVFVWAAWVSGTSVRVGQVGAALPNDELGVISGLFPVVPARTISLTHCFDYLGLMHMAIESVPAGVITLRWYPSDSDSTDDSQEVKFQGESPLLFNLVNVDPSGGAGVVCYYLKPEVPFALFAKFSQDLFGKGKVSGDAHYNHEVHSALRVNLVRLLSIHSEGDIVVMYAIDDLGNDITLRSAKYSLNFLERATSDLTFVSGFCGEAAVEIGGESDNFDPQEQKALASFQFMSGRIVDGSAETPTLVEEKGVLDIDFEFGLIEQIVFP